MFYISQILEELLYYCNINKYFHKICNYLQQYRWHNNILVHDKYKTHPRTDVARFKIYCARYNYYGFYEQHVYFSPLVLSCESSDKITIEIVNTHVTIIDGLNQYKLSWNNIFKHLRDYSLVILTLSKKLRQF
jgi:hypothetical protein